MLTVNKLEKIIELEEKLRGEYQAKLDASATELELCRLYFHHEDMLATDGKVGSVQASSRKAPSGNPSAACNSSSPVLSTRSSVTTF